MAEHEHQPNLAKEFVKPAFDLSETFIQRWDIQARQLENGRYVCIHKPLKTQHLMSHLQGDITLGTYVLDRDSKCRFVVFDADDDESFINLVESSRQFQSDNMKPYLETSRRGGHLWLFFSQPIAGVNARQFGSGVILAHEISNVELFPKQDQLAKGPGSLVRLPFGFHKLTKRRYPFISREGKRIAPSVREQINILADSETVPVDAFEKYCSLVDESPLKSSFTPSEDIPQMLSDQIKQNVSVFEFVSQYVDLKPTNWGGIGLCPFHDDHNPSFSVNDAENYWCCFAGCGGGSVIDFWMKWRGCGFVSTIRELASIILGSNYTVF